VGDIEDYGGPAARHRSARNVRRNNTPDTRRDTRTPFEDPDGFRVVLVPERWYD
jgi:hypothetical protein